MRWFIEPNLQDDVRLYAREGNRILTRSSCRCSFRSISADYGDMIALGTVHAFHVTEHTASVHQHQLFGTTAYELKGNDVSRTQFTALRCGLAYSEQAPLGKRR